MSNTSPETVLEIVLAVGVGSFFTEVGRRMFGRKRARIDAAAVVQEAALELIEPIRRELREARDEAAKLRAEMSTLRDDFDSVLSWAHEAVLEFQRLGSDFRPIPNIRRVQ